MKWVSEMHIKLDRGQELLSGRQMASNAQGQLATSDSISRVQGQLTFTRN